jgi:tellurium resistance protein TerD
MSLTMKLQKPGEVAPKLRLSLNKGSRFLVELFWDSSHDLDAHALLAVNDGNGAKISSFEQVLSTYNSKKTSAQGVLETNADGSFSTPCQTLTHSGDSRNGTAQDIDEVITVDGSKIPAGVNEIPIFVTIHNSATSGLSFSKVVRAGIRIKDESGKVLGEYELSSEFARFNAVQMGSLICGSGGWEFATVGNGFSGDFNSVLEHFS